MNKASLWLTKHRYWLLGYSLAAILGWCLFAWVHQYYGLVLNDSPSMPAGVYWVVKQTTDWQIDDLVAVNMHDTGLYPAGQQFLKKIGGVPGDLVTRVDREFFVNGVSRGIAKTESRAGVPLEAGLVGVIPADRYYLYTQALNSFDSRYAAIGWVTKQQIVGRAYLLF